LMAGLVARGRRAGGDFAVVGFDDIPEASVASPTLTTIAVDPRARGRQAAELILKRLREPELPHAHTVAPVRLQARSSSEVLVPPPGESA
ncbi:substrate-binding domain-containing protein, partial [Lysobacter sp. 2RAB21]